MKICRFPQGFVGIGIVQKSLSYIFCNSLKFGNQYPWQFSLRDSCYISLWTCIILIRVMAGCSLSNYILLQTLLVSKDDTI
jgi:hypothetical protein